MTKLSEIRQALSTELSQLNARMTKSLDSSNELMNQVIEGYMEKKGKQLRPILVILAARMFGTVTDKVIAAAAALELLHNASLIHDDVVDDSSTRHGCATINAVWDNHIAVLVGDYFVSTALREAIFTENLRVVDTIGCLGQMLSLGEMDQICNARFHFLDEESYIKVISHKTASLFVSCVKIGCYTVGASEANVDALVAFAELFGRCFQIRDDIYDYFEDESIGKPTGNDLREGKVTLPLLYALSSGYGDAESMRRLVQQDVLAAEEITRLIDYAKQAGGIEYAFSVIDTLASEARGIIDKLPQGQSADMLRLLIDSVTER